MAMAINGSMPSSSSLFSPWWSIRPVQGGAMVGTAHSDGSPTRRDNGKSDVQPSEQGFSTYFDPDGTTGSLLNIYV